MILILKKLGNYIKETLNKSSAGFGGSFDPIFAFENLGKL